MSVVQSEVRRGAYFDSVILLQLQRSLIDLPQVLDAGVAMGTEANRKLLAATGLLPEGVAAGADDLLIVVRTESEADAAAALQQVDALLKRRRSTVSEAYRPKSLATASAHLPEAAWVLISVPGRYAATVAREALALNKHVFLYSDNVSLADEIALKQLAGERGRLLMGPDCGTAIVNGIGLGFANRVRPGPIGLVGASGTGLQAITSEIHNLGSGISQAFGTGGRDLKAEVGAATARQALAMLAADTATEVIVLVSKPPDPGVAADLLALAQQAGKPVVVNFIGYAAPFARMGNLAFASSLRQAAVLAVDLAGRMLPENEAESASRVPGQQGRYLRALFSGGTLAYEALVGLQSVLNPIYSNVPVSPDQALKDVMASQEHTVLDLGDDVFTQGRLHPMMDNDLRLRRLRQEAADPEVALILLDLVLGEGAHPDPAAELAPAIRAAGSDRQLEVVVILVGTEEDPQDIERQMGLLQSAGARVYRNVDQAVDYVARQLAQPNGPGELDPRWREAFQGSLAAINVGLESFYESLLGQGATAVQVDWRPPAGGNERMMNLLARLKS